MTPAHWVSLAAFGLALLVQTVALIRWFTRREVEAERNRQIERETWRAELHGLETRMRMDTASAKSEGADAQRKVIELELRMERTLKQHPTKDDIRDMLMPISTRLDSLYDVVANRRAPLHE